MQSPEAVEAYSEGDSVQVDPAAGTVKVAEREFGFPPLPDEMLEILEDGGLLNHIKKEFAAEEKA